MTKHKKFNEQFHRIETFRNELLKKVASYPEEILHKKPAPHQWSAMEALQHLVVAETGTNRYLRKKLMGVEKLPYSGMKNELRIGLGKILLALPIKYKAPDVVAHPPANVSLQETIQQWNQCRAEFKQIAESLKETDLNKLVFRHPFFGLLNFYQTMEFFDNHTRRHAKQVFNTLQRVK